MLPSSFLVDSPHRQYTSSGSGVPEFVSGICISLASPGQALCAASWSWDMAGFDLDATDSLGPWTAAGRWRPRVLKGASLDRTNPRA